MPLDQFFVALKPLYKYIYLQEESIQNERHANTTLGTRDNPLCHDLFVLRQGEGFGASWAECL